MLFVLFINYSLFVEDALGLTASSDYELAVSALGACIWYLSKCLIDHDIVSLKRFELYEPVDQDVRTSPEELDHYIATRQHMVSIQYTFCDVLNERVRMSEY